MNTVPANAGHTVFDPKIVSISSEFQELFQEAETAEKKELKKICGPGYRKALEFLVKDYAIRENPDKAEVIKKQMLAPCINEFIDDPRIKFFATRAVWLGNDETHYVRKWTDHELSDLKRLISITVNWLLLVEESRELKESFDVTTTP